MANVSWDKIVSALPAVLEPNKVYAVRLGSGFDLYQSDSTGSSVYRVNDNSPFRINNDLNDILDGVIYTQDQGGADWTIKRITTTDGVVVVESAAGSNDASTAWTNRATQVYS